uniref:Uncharacterized protein n=1 Tax=Aureoumbra lagunensis TaxID=44058 RepID=A0A7S3JV68_9STRA|eukprot:CAMPEP_0197292306 /NCGR_PEP_ID=MMETSP0890-20130614/22366_1 /TAXON_ID=44058 ORGANISM="Aureoumbra lagunensis, Strain CCMP1510" /NCGR_SAMPLE_ID=MMETSP0890 /ASSEMBLY_ACC=CAM_ASM_000533 /LENGTH=174 /DNA_ID=CAMNT_0042766095 /DNA_START=281 /DNA_END=805 /DNA_ORIENTATION=-
MDDLSPMEREKMTTTIEIWQRHHDRKISPSASSIGGQSSVPQAVAHDEITSQDSVDAIEERALEQSSMQPDDSSSNIYAKHVEAYAHEISELRNQLSTYDQKIDTITKTCEQRVQIVEQALRQAQSSNKSTPSFNYFGTIGFSSLTFLFFIGASALLVADLCHQFPNDLHRATH